jgi:hypothetical protein
MCTPTENPMLSQSDFTWLREATQGQLQGCQLVAHDGTHLYTPDGVGSYAALWTRDFGYMVENAFDLIPREDTQAAIRYLLAGQRADGCIPDRVQADGLAVYSAGPVGHPLGDPPTDNSQFMVKLVADYTNHTGDLDFFKETSAQLVAAMNFTPRSANGLVFIDPQNPHSPYGFADTIQKTGELLFSSLLYWEACSQLAFLFEKTKQPDLHREFINRREQIEHNLDCLWNAEVGMYLAATVDCRQIDIWGNAYAIYLGFPLGSKKDRIVTFLARNFEKFVYKGQIRHLTQPDAWEKTLIPVSPETYQNGAYWGTASGWVALALSEKYPNRARQIFTELIHSFRTEGIFECVNRDYQKVPHYVVSITNPLGAYEKLILNAK